MIVDKMYFEVPDLMKDAYWDHKHINLPVTEATAAFKKVHMAGTTSHLQYGLKKFLCFLLQSGKKYGRADFLYIFYFIFIT